LDIIILFNLAGKKYVLKLEFYQRKNFNFLGEKKMREVGWMLKLPRLLWWAGL